MFILNIILKTIVVYCYTITIIETSSKSSYNTSNISSENPPKSSSKTSSEKDDIKVNLGHPNGSIRWLGGDQAQEDVSRKETVMAEAENSDIHGDIKRDNIVTIESVQVKYKCHPLYKNHESDMTSQSSSATIELCESGDLKFDKNEYMGPETPGDREN